MTLVADTIDGCFRRHAQDHPERIFAHLHSGAAHDVVRYGELWQRSLDQAEHYRRNGVAPGEVVIIMLKGGIELYAAFMGAMLLGAIPAFMPYPTPKQEAGLFWAGHRTLFARIRPRAVLTYPDIAPMLAETLPSESLLLLATDAIAGSGAATRHSAPEEVAFLQHSSGTTGTKKGVMLTHRAVLAQVSSYRQAIRFDSESTIATWLPLYHDMGLIACFMLPLVLGATICQINPVEWVGAPMRLVEMIERHRATHVWMPNFAFDHLAFAARREPRRFDLSSLVAIINCSEPCKPQSMRNLVDGLATSGMTPRIPQVCYAMAETVFAVTQTPLGHVPHTLDASMAALAADRFAIPEDEADTRSLASCGRPIDGLSLKIVGSDGAPVPEGEVGEICATGASLYDGYHLLPAATAERLKGGWHHTGDLGFLHDGELYVTGRKDDLIIVRGRNFYAHDLEAVVNAMPGVKPGRCVIFTIDNVRMGTAEAICLIELLPEAEAVAVRKAIKAEVEIASGLTLSRVVALPQGSLVKTTSGKISRDMNKKRYGDGVFKGIEA